MMKQILRFTFCFLFLCCCAFWVQPTDLYAQEEKSGQLDKEEERHLKKRLKRKKRDAFLGRFALTLAQNTMLSERPSGVDFYGAPGADYLFKANFPTVDETVSHRMMFLWQIAPDAESGALYLRGLYYGLEWNFWTAFNNRLFFHLVTEFQFFNEREVLSDGYRQTLSIGPCFGLLVQLRVMKNLTIISETGFCSTFTHGAEYDRLDLRTSGRRMQWLNEPHRVLSLGIRFYFGHV